MRYVNRLFISAVFLLLIGCARLDCKPEKGTVITGTDTAVVELRLDKNGYPQPNVEQVTVAPGQKIIFIGPNQFDIVFKDNRSPIEKPEVRSLNGIVAIEIPKNIFAIEDRKDPENKTKNEIIYRYGIRVNGKLTDPTIRISPR